MFEHQGRARYDNLKVSAPNIYCTTAMFSDEIFPNEQNSAHKKENKIESQRKISVIEPTSVLNSVVDETQSSDSSSQKINPKQKNHSRIVFDLDDTNRRKKPILERLGKRRDYQEDGADFRTDVKKSKLNDNKRGANHDSREDFREKLTKKAGVKSDRDKKSKSDREKNSDKQVSCFVIF